MLQYRRLEFRDIKFVKPLIDLNLTESIPYLFLVNKMIQKNSVDYVCCIGPKIVGFILTEFEEKDTIVIEYLCVNIEMRNQGVGTHFLDLIKTQCTKINLYVRVDNIAAIKLYLKNGFVIHKRNVPYYENGSLAHLMSFGY